MPRRRQTASAYHHVCHIILWPKLWACTAVLLYCRLTHILPPHPLPLPLHFGRRLALPLDSPVGARHVPAPAAAAAEREATAVAPAASKGKVYSTSTATAAATAAKHEEGEAKHAAWGAAERGIKDIISST